MDRGISGRLVAEIRLGSGSVPVVGFVECLPDLLTVLGDVRLRGHDAAIVARFELRAGVAAVSVAGWSYFLGWNIAPGKALPGLRIGSAHAVITFCFVLVGAFMC